MNPIIINHPDHKGRWIVDADSASAHYHPETGKTLVHYETAVSISDLRPGSYRIGTGHGEPLNPSAARSYFKSKPYKQCPLPCVLAQGDDKHKAHQFLGKGSNKRQGDIMKRAAIQLLRLAASYNNLTACRITESFSFGDHRTEKPKQLRQGIKFVPWDEWKFHTAWHWSAWELEGGRVTLAQRYAQMKAAGYPHGQKAFERMHRELFPKPTN